MFYEIDTDIVIIGGGFMGLAIAHQASLKGLRSVVLERGKIKGPHYMTGLLSPRADYMPFDMESVQKTASECVRIQNLFPDAVKPQLFLMPINQDTPYGYDCFKALLEFYDKKTKPRLGLLPSGHYRISQTKLEQMEPNLRKGHFSRALAFYELTTESNILLKEIQKKLDCFGDCRRIAIKEIAAYVMEQERIKEVHILTGARDNISISNKDGKLTVVNAAGPWLGEVLKALAINLPIEFSLGIQLSVPRKSFFQSSIITFTDKGKYAICMQKPDHIQVGPTNTSFTGSPDELPQNKEDIDRLIKAFQNIIEPDVPENIVIKSSGLRVKLKLPYCHDTNRPLIFRTKYDNFYSIYPGKTALAFSAADELLENIGYRKTSSRHSLDGNKKYKNVLLLNLACLKSMLRLGIHMIFYFLKLPF